MADQRPDRNEVLLTAWQQAIQTQMHFAELSMKMRQIGLALAGATIALAITIHDGGERGFTFDLGDWNAVIPVSAVLCVAAAVILFAAWRIDVGVYHEMLRGAVRFNEELEPLMDGVIGWRTGLTESISAISRGRDEKLLATRNAAGKFWEFGTPHPASNRINHFYWITIGALLLAALALAFADPSATNPTPGSVG